MGVGVDDVDVGDVGDVGGDACVDANASLDEEE
jgi:hypothetical protein